jgi:hypothetical protein
LTIPTVAEALERRSAWVDQDMHSMLVSSPSLAQLPLKLLAQCSTDGVTPQEFLDALNGRVSSGGPVNA